MEFVFHFLWRLFLLVHALIHSLPIVCPFLMWVEVFPSISDILLSICLDISVSWWFCDTNVVNLDWEQVLWNVLVVVHILKFVHKFHKVLKWWEIGNWVGSMQAFAIFLISSLASDILKLLTREYPTPILTFIWFSNAGKLVYLTFLTQMMVLLTQ